MGEVFAGRYELVDPIGRGGAGAVWRAWDRRRGRYVAAKVLLQSDAHSLLRFVREQALRIDHPHVLAPTNWAADDDKVLFTMGLVRGGSLAHLIGDYGPLPVRYVSALLDQLLSGLAAVHAENVVHRDIKPANLLLEATGTGRPHLRLSDFGIAMRKGEPRLTATHHIVGTPGYFAPEQLLGAEPHFTADLYATGLVALYLLSGAKPDAEAIVTPYVHGMPRAPHGVPGPLWEVIGTLLQPDPEARFRTASGARAALAAAVELLPDQEPDEDAIEVFDQIGPLPAGFSADGPVAPTPSAEGTGSVTGSFRLQPPAGTPEPATPAPTPPTPPTPPTRPYTTTVTGDTAPIAAPAAPLAPPVLPPPSPSVAFPSVASPSVASPSVAPPSVASPSVAPPAQVAPPAPFAPAAAAAPARRPGPPAKVVVPMLLVAACCLAFGFWALSATS